MNPNPYAPPSAPMVAGSRTGSITPQRAAEIQKEIKINNLLSFALGIPGIGLQVIGRNMGGILGGVTSLVGTALLMGGLVFYARLRGRSAVYALFGLLSCVGLLVLYFIPKYCLNCRTKASYGKKQCEACGAPLGM
jgi:hypothetical protein